MTSVADRRHRAHGHAIDHARAAVGHCRATALSLHHRGPPTALVIDGTPARRARMVATLEGLGYRALTAWTPLDAITHLGAVHGRVVLAAIAEDARDGQLLRAFLAERYPEIHVVVIADRVRAGTIVEAQLASTPPRDPPLPRCLA